jgi:hypothetical protein
LSKAQRLWRIDWWRRRRIGVGQAVQDIENMGLGRDPSIKCKLDRAQYRLLIMMEHECQYLCHLPIAAWSLEDLPLQLRERLGELGKGCAIAQDTGFALDNGQIMVPIL